MALRTIEPFMSISHAYSGSIATLTGPLSNYNLPYYILGGDTATYARLIQLLKSEDWLRLYGTGSVSGNRRLALGRPFKDMGITFTDQSVVYGGVRMKFLLGAPTTLVYIVPAAAVAGLSLVRSVDLPGGGVVTGREYYIEWCIDLPNNQIRTRIDGVAGTTYTLSSTWKTSLLGQTVHLMYGAWDAGTASTLDIYLKDGYVLEKTPDGLLSSWLGPQIVRPLVVNDIIAPWTSSSGQSGKDTLNQAVDSSPSRLTPVLTSDPEETEAVVTFDTTPIQGRINGVAFEVDAIKTPGKAGALEIQLAAGGGSSNKFKIATTTTMESYHDLLLSSATPGGAAWNKDLLAAATLKLKPLA